jgi:ABC-2 type transport system permease protein
VATPPPEGIYYWTVTASSGPHPVDGYYTWNVLTAGDAGGSDSGDASGGSASAADTASAGSGFEGLIAVKMTDARAEEGIAHAQETPSMVAYYAAGIGVMFLLFSMTGAAGSLLEEEESGSLERVLASNISMGSLLLGKWLFFGVLGILQVVMMFVWGALVFGLDLFTPNHFTGFLAMTVVTGASAAAFGIFLATLARSRSQLGGMSTIVILIMSALGGSMVPRFVMPDFMNTTVLFTFNGWALDGYLKVFWHDDPAPR